MGDRVERAYHPDLFLLEGESWSRRSSSGRKERMRLFLLLLSLPLLPLLLELLLELLFELLLELLLMSWFLFLLREKGVSELGMMSGFCCFCCR